MILAAVLLCSCSRQDTAVATAPALVEGKLFPDIMLNYSSGAAISTHSFKGRLLVLNVWATWCPPCRREMPALEQLSKTLDPKRFAVVGISTDEDALLAEEFLRQTGITFTNFLDPGGKIAKSIGMQVYPETFLISADGVLLRRMPGFQEWGSAEMIAQLEQTYRDSSRNKPAH